MWPTDLVAHGIWDLSSQTRDRTHVACTGRQVLNHWTTKKVPEVKYSYSTRFKRAIEKKKKWLGGKEFNF